VFHDDELGMQYLRSYQYLFDNPNWLTNLLAGTVAILVPIVGPIVLIGYQFEILEKMHVAGDDSYPDFDTNRLGKYLGRGVWPFLIQLIVQMVLGMLIGVSWAFVMIVTALASANNEQAAGAIFLIVVCCMLLVTVIVNLLLPLVMIPVLLRAGLTQDFAASFSMDFVREFVGKMWVEMVLTQLFLMVTGLILGVIGFLACFIGIYPAVALISFAHAHLLHQLYELYLQRGGSEIPLKAEPVAY
jgi:hypothetical protein